MRAADGSTQLVGGGPEAERAFAETQLLQQQLQTGNAQDKLGSAWERASQIASENIARQQAEREALRVDSERQARLALDRDAQAEQATQNRARIEIDAADREQQNQLRLNDQKTQRARYQAAAQLDSDKLKQSATQFAKNLALQEGQLEDRRQKADFDQKKETDRIAEGLLKQMRGKRLTDEGQKAVAELSSIYRGIAKNKGGMRGHQYDSMMQDWLDLAESANIDQYALEQQTVGDQFAGEFEIVPIQGRDGVTRQYEVQRDADGRLSYERLEQEAGPQVYRSVQERARAVAESKELQNLYMERAGEALAQQYGANEPNWRPTHEQLFNKVEDLIRKDQELQNRLSGMGQIAPQATLGGSNLSMGRSESVGDMSALINGIGSSAERKFNAERKFSPLPTSPGDTQAPQQYPSPQEATKLDTWGGSKTDYGSMRKQLFEDGGGFYGTDRPGMKRLTDPAERSFYKAMKAHRTGPTEEHKKALNEMMVNDVEGWSRGKPMKDLSEAIHASDNPFKFDPSKLLNQDILLKMIQAGVKDPLGNAAKGMAEAIRSGNDHYGTHSTPSYHRELNPPLLPRESFENLTGDGIEKLPVIWMDEFGMLYQRDESARPKEDPRDAHKRYRKSVQGIRN